MDRSFLLVCAGCLAAVGLLRAERQADQWVEQQLARLTLAQKVGQLLMPSSLTGPADVESLARHRDLVQQYAVGGWLALGGEVASARRLLQSLQQASTIPLLTAVDSEGGLGIRLSGATRFPRAMALAAGSTPDDIRAIGRATMLEAMATGIRVAFYPVVDVNTNPDNPIISIRAFGDDPSRVAELAQSYIEGVESAGGVATVKHFPGHGDTAVNSHLDLPIVASDRARLDRVELLPFRQAISSGVRLVMTGHLSVPALDPTGTPATLSRPILEQLLRRQMGFDGIIVTDALNMRGLPRERERGELAVRAFEAGADLLLMPLSVPDAVDGLVGAIKKGRLSVDRLDASVRRILTLKARLGLDVAGAGAESTVQLPNETHRLLAQRAMERAVTLVRDDEHILPLDPSRSHRPLVLSIVSTGGRPQRRRVEWAAQVRRRRPASLQQSVSATLSSVVRNRLVAQAEASDVVLLAIYLKVSDSVGRIALSDGQLTLIRELLAAETPVAAVIFGSPYVLDDLPPLPALVLTYEDYSGAERAAVRALFGEIPFQGRLPVTLPGIAPAGYRLTR